MWDFHINNLYKFTYLFSTIILHEENNSLTLNVLTLLRYRLFKTELKIEEYISILPYNYMFNFCKFRCGGHRLPVETGRWHNVSRADRLCQQ
jgi:hypothetical protein